MRKKVGEEEFDDLASMFKEKTINDFLLRVAYDAIDRMPGTVYPRFYDSSVHIDNFPALFEWIGRIRRELEAAGFRAQHHATFLSFGEEQLKINLAIKSDSEIEGTIHLLHGDITTYTSTLYLNKGPILPTLLTGLNHQLVNN